MHGRFNLQIILSVVATWNNLSHISIMFIDTCIGIWPQTISVTDVSQMSVTYL